MSPDSDVAAPEAKTLAGRSRAAAAEKPDVPERLLKVGRNRMRADQALDVVNPATGALIARTYLAGHGEAEAAIAAAVEGFEETRALPAYRRAEILDNISAALKEQREEIARTIALEAGKPIRDARGEVDRAVFTFRYAAEEAKRIEGAVIPLDLAAPNKGRTALYRKFPLGPVLAICPYNFPLNLVAHKLAPAIAAGDSVVVKPSPYAPLTPIRLGEIAKEAGMPDAALSVIPSDVEVSEKLVRDGRFKLVSFTGSPRVGWHIKGLAGRKRVVLELGGNGGAIVHRDADLDHAAARCAFGGFTYAGQTCIKAQRIYVQEEVHRPFLDRFLARVGKLKVGDPLDEETDIGPLIHEKEAERVEEWVVEAVRGGATLLCGGRRRGAYLDPTVLVDVEPGMKVHRFEVFGPVTLVAKYKDPAEAIARVNDSDYGLQAGLFTNDLRLVQRAFREIEVGGLIVNDVPTYRADHMPYGGVKFSGFGREGLKYAIEDMMETRLLVLPPE